jgi:hypothetical protein
MIRQLLLVQTVQMPQQVQLAGAATPQQQQRSRLRVVVRLLLRARQIQLLLGMLMGKRQKRMVWRKMKGLQQMMMIRQLGGRCHRALAVSISTCRV